MAGKNLQEQEAHGAAKDTSGKNDSSKNGKTGDVLKWYFSGEKTKDERSSAELYCHAENIMGLTDETAKVMYAVGVKINSDGGKATLYEERALAKLILSGRSNYGKKSVPAEDMDAEEAPVVEEADEAEKGPKTGYGDELLEELRGIREELEGYDGRFDNIEDAQGKTDNKITGIYDRLDEHDGKFKEYDNAISDAVGEFKAASEGLAKEIGQMRKDVTSLLETATPATPTPPKSAPPKEPGPEAKEEGPEEEPIEIEVLEEEPEPKPSPMPAPVEKRAAAEEPKKQKDAAVPVYTVKSGGKVRDWMIYEGDLLRRLGLLAKDADTEEAKDCIVKLGGKASDIVKITEKDIKESEGWFASRITVVDKIVVVDGSDAMKNIETAIDTANDERQTEEMVAAPIGEPGYLKKIFDYVKPDIKEGEAVSHYLMRKFHIVDEEQEEAPSMAHYAADAGKKPVKKEQLKTSEETPENWGAFDDGEGKKEDVGDVYVYTNPVEGIAGGETVAEAVPEYTEGDVIPEGTPEAVETEEVIFERFDPVTNKTKYYNADEEGELMGDGVLGDKKAGKDSKPEGGGKDFTDFL